ncbi:SDR family oxidoreductase [Akkermansiaceae bacterium]|nr:SDR family oxidoreductase [Akkermansiaceae bacterium]
MVSHLSNEFDLIIAGNSGIGLTTVELFSSKGRDLIVTCRHITEEFKVFCNTLMEKFDINIILLELDIIEPDQIVILKKYLFSNKIVVRSMILIAGKAHGGVLLTTHLRDIKEVFEVNYFAQLNLIQNLHRFLSKNGSGTIIFISSIVGFDTAKGSIAYGGSKTLINYTIPILAEEFSLNKIRVNGVAPSLTDTRMAKLMDKDAFTNMVERSFSKRLAAPMEISNVIYFLASEESNYINGQIIRADGGMH